MAARNTLANKARRRAEREENRKLQERKRLIQRVKNTDNWFTKKPVKEETND